MTLEYAARNPPCVTRMLSQGFGSTGFALALRKNSPHTELFNSVILTLRENGYLENLRKNWINGPCPGIPYSKQDNLTSHRVLAAGFSLSTYGLYMLKGDANHVNMIQPNSQSIENVNFILLFGDNVTTKVEYVSIFISGTFAILEICLLYMCTLYNRYVTLREVLVS